MYGIVKNMSDVTMWKMFQLFFKRKNRNAPRNGKWKEFNKNAVLISEGYYENDIKHGNWRQFYETGELLLEENYQYGILHGRYATYHPNGRVLSEGEYQHGKREGFFKVFDENGAQIRRLLFVNNILLEEGQVGLKAQMAV